MDFITCEGLRTAYVRSGGRGRTVVLVHGNSSSARGWGRQLEGPLGRRFDLVALDLPGHGDSGRAPADIADRYSIAFYGRWLAGALAALGCADAPLVGHSLGGHIVLDGLALGTLRRPAAVMVHGTPPVNGAAEIGRGFRPHPLAGLLFGGEMSRADADALGAALFGPHAPAPEALVDDLLRTDPEARLGLARGIDRDGFPHERALIERADFPVALVHAADDAFVQRGFLEEVRASALWRGRAQVIAGAGHYLQWEHPEVFDALLGDLLDGL